MTLHSALCTLHLRACSCIDRLKHVRILLKGLRNGLQEVTSYVALFGLFLFVATLAGMQLFGGSFQASARQTPDANFDSFPRGVVTALQLITGSEWGVAMYETMNVAGPAAAVYFVLVVVLGKCVLEPLPRRSG